MTVTIFGATGMVGKQLVKQALFLGYKVIAYGRNVHELIEEAEQDKNLILLKGGLFDKSDVAAAIKETNIVLSALGGAMDGADNTRSLGIKYIIEAMEKHNVSRIIAIGGLGCLQADEDTLIAETEQFPPQYKPVTEEHLKALQYLIQSSLEWTFVCPPMIVPADVTGIYQTKANYPVGMGSINAGDLAQFMLGEATKNNYVNVKVAIAN